MTRVGVGQGPAPRGARRERRRLRHEARRSRDVMGVACGVRRAAMSAPFAEERGEAL